jgi:MinD-like ATPase involved in chromosome partitioning or flagellar assembly
MMGLLAPAARLQNDTAASTAEHQSAVARPLRFTSPDGPLLAVVGVCGGAGASTLSWMIAAAAATSSSVPVLVCDTGGPTAGLSACAGIRSPRTLAETAQILSEGELPRGALYAQSSAGPRVIAGEPQFTVAESEDGVRVLLKDARQAHGLSVVDAGTLSRQADRIALTEASHVAWVLPASMDGLLRAGRFLERIIPLGRPELVVARAQPHARRPPLSALVEVAEDRDAPLVLMPDIGETLDVEASALIERAEVSLEAIGCLLHR